jgi:hypothetical protein
MEMKSVVGRYSLVPTILFCLARKSIAANRVEYGIPVTAITVFLRKIEVSRPWIRLTPLYSGLKLAL